MTKEYKQKVEIYKMLKNDDVSFDTLYNFLQDNEIGNLDSVNCEDMIKQYCYEMIEKGVHVSHIVEALETHPSDTEMYSIWLGNSMETPTPINTKEDLVEALEVELPKVVLALKIQDKEIYPEGQWVKITNEYNKDYVNDEDIYYYVDDDVNLNDVAKGDTIYLDEDFKVLEVQ